MSSYRSKPLAPFSTRLLALSCATAASGIFVLSACGSDDFVTPTAAPSSSSTTTEPGPCPRGPISPAQNADEKLLTAELEKLSFPAGTCFFMVDTVDRSDEPGKIAITVDLNVAASSSPDDLRPAATEIAHLLKKSAVATRTSVVDVTNAGAAKPTYRTLLTDENFQEHPWNGTPSTEAELAIWRIVNPG
ncbi:hypothetical protein [Nocardia vulneris]|uniref:hypothetical protein n=1 Tax=Nocardia vulneris TaxID=1141657 RepID=UPI000ADAF119|nr:hypothetical protein [Nocardia vulneris]